MSSVRSAKAGREGSDYLKDRKTETRSYQDWEEQFRKEENSAIKNQMWKELTVFCNLSPRSLTVTASKTRNNCTRRIAPPPCLAKKLGGNTQELQNE